MVDTNQCAIAIDNPSSDYSCLFHNQRVSDYNTQLSVVTYISLRQGISTRESRSLYDESIMLNMITITDKILETRGLLPLAFSTYSLPNQLIYIGSFDRKYAQINQESQTVEV